jgi:L-ascorbate metabolism protein UlaG (beta-lactamase superfamily)
VIEPRNAGKSLIEEIAGSRPVDGSVCVWWLGQSGFLLKSARATILIDPYLSEHLTRKYEGTSRPHVRMTRAPLRGAELSGIDLLLASHKHSDHLDPGTAPDVLASSPDAVLGLPAPLLEHAESLGIARDRLVGLEADKPFQIPGATVRPIPSAHEVLDTDDSGRHLYLGFVIELGGLRFYHSGDSLAYDGLAERLGGMLTDVMFLPINGRDPSRGVPGNMTAREAVGLASVVRPRYVVPHHYDMFTFNTVPVEVFVQEARALPADVRPKVLACGERWGVSRWA